MGVIFLASMELNSNYMDINKYLIIPLFCFLSSCGGSSSTDSSENNQVSTDVVPNAFGRLIDSEVIGLKYKSGEYEDHTDENGGFGYILGEQIQFFVGDIAIGYQVEPKDILTPYELANNNSFAAFNIVRFLQSLDDDNLLDNGIQIIESSHTLAKDKTVDFLSQDWGFLTDENLEIEQLIYSLTSQTLAGSRYLVSVSDAYVHYSSTLVDMMDDIEEQIVNEINISGCSTNSDCSVFVVEPTRLDLCFLPNKYIYSNITTPIDRIESLKEERSKLRDINSELKNAANIYDTTSVLCTIHENVRFQVCNSQQQCEFSDSFPIGSN